MKLFIGLDVSLAKTAVCVVSEHGQIVKEGETGSEPEALVRWLDEVNGSIAAIGLEAGPLSQWLHRGLTEAGLDAVGVRIRGQREGHRRWRTVVAHHDDHGPRQDPSQPA